MSFKPKQHPRQMPSKDAAQLVGYTCDYVARLAREGKVVAQKIDGQWWIDIDSLKLFTLQTEAHARERKAQLRQDRLTELATEKLKRKQTKMKAVLDGEQPVAVLATATFSVCCLLLLFIAGSAYTQKLSLVALASGAHTTFSEIAATFAWLPWSKQDPQVTSSHTASSEPVPAASAPRPMASGVLVADATADQAVFSDPIATTTDSRVRVITPVFTDASSQTYTVLVTPVGSTTVTAI